MGPPRLRLSSETQLREDILLRTSGEIGKAERTNRTRLLWSSSSTTTIYSRNFEKHIFLCFSHCYEFNAGKNTNGHFINSIKRIKRTELIRQNALNALNSFERNKRYEINCNLIERMKRINNRLIIAKPLNSSWLNHAEILFHNFVDFINKLLWVGNALSLYRSALKSRSKKRDFFKIKNNRVSRPFFNRTRNNRHRRTFEFSRDRKTS